MVVMLLLLLLAMVMVMVNLFASVYYELYTADTVVGRLFIIEDVLLLC